MPTITLLNTPEAVSTVKQYNTQCRISHLPNIGICRYLRLSIPNSHYLNVCKKPRNLIAIKEYQQFQTLLMLNIEWNTAISLATKGRVVFKEEELPF